MTHIYNFVDRRPNPYSSKEWVSFISSKIEEKMGEIEDDGYYDDEDEWVKEDKSPHLFEIVLSDGQLTMMPKLVKALQRMGFKLVTRFINGNTDSTLNVFHLVHGERTPTKLPFIWSY